MKIVCTGQQGRVGSLLVKRGIEPIDFELTDPENVKDVIETSNPDIIIHCAGLTSVDECEKDPIKAFDVNVRGIHNMLFVSPNARNRRIIYISTDHVFSGDKMWLPSEKNKPAPVNIYGTTKYMAEQMLNFSVGKHNVIRTSKLFYYNLILDDLHTLKIGEKITMPEIIRKTFLHVDHFINGLMVFVDRVESMPNLLHISATDKNSYYTFWLNIAKVFKVPYEQVIPRYKELPDMTPRPLNGGLNSELAKRLGIPVYSTMEGIRYMKEKLEK